MNAMPQSQLDRLAREKVKAAHEQLRHNARTNYWEYVKYVNDGRIKDTKFHKFLCGKVQEFVEMDGDPAYDILILETSPQSGKSLTVTEALPSWYLGKNPMHRVIEVSYNEDFASFFGRSNKRKIAAHGKDLFDIELATSPNSATEFQLTNNVGGMISRGIMSGITGKSGNCFFQGTMVMTELGEIEISSLCAMENAPLVLSYSHKSDTLEWKKIIATKRSVSNGRRVFVRTSGGNCIESTREHLYYTEERGYEQAAFLARGDSLVAIQRDKVPDLRRGEGPGEQGLPYVLPCNQENFRDFKVRRLRERVFDDSCGVRKTPPARYDSPLLFKGVRFGWAQGVNVSEVQGVRDACAKRPHVLWESLQACVELCKRRKGSVPSLWEGVPKKGTVKRSGSYILRERVRLICALAKNEGGRKLKLQELVKLCFAVQKHAACDSGEGRLEMCCLREANGVYCGGMERSERRQDGHVRASCGRRHVEQPSGESAYSVQGVPCSSSSCSRGQGICDSVESVDFVSGAEDDVYDIQIEGNSNFFANGILVHNCIIIDDPLKNRQEADSQTVRDAIWSEWQNSIKTRLQAKSKVIVISTRWHEDDLVGRIIATEKNVTRLSFPCECEDPETDLLGRNLGDALVPEIGKDNAWLESFKRSYVLSDGMRAWNALFQQRPSSAEGNMIKREYWEWCEKLPDTIPFTCVTVDCAYKDTSKSDFVAIQLWGKWNARFICISTSKKRLNFLGTLEEIKNMVRTAKGITGRSPDAIYVESAANGEAVISVLRERIEAVIPVVVRESKEARVQACLPLFEAHQVYLWKECAGAQDLIEECAGFPHLSHDDATDACSMALNKMRGVGADVGGTTEAEDFFAAWGGLNKPEPMFGEVTRSYIEFGF